jgi:similar to stage IV sporulation protein
MNISVREFRELKPVIKKTGTKVRIMGRVGLPFFLHRYRKRRLFFAGGVLCVFLILLMSRYIWQIDISGNQSRTDDTLLEFLETKDVKAGMHKSAVDCARIVKDIRKEYDDIIWVSASIQGTRLIIQIKENEDAAVVQDALAEDESLESLGDNENKESGEMNSETSEINSETSEMSSETSEEEWEAPTDLVADRDCTITDIVVRNGVTQVSEGDEVKKGDLLVSGQVPVNNDDGEVIDYQYYRSDADIQGEFTISYQEELPLVHDIKTYGKQRWEFYITAHSSEKNWYLSIFPLKHRFASSEIHTTEYSLKLGTDFYLPVSYGIKREISYETTQENYTEEELRTLLTAKFERYCAELEKKGVEIIENDVKIYTGPQIAEAKGMLTVIAPVGKAAPSSLQEIPVTEEQEESGE